jgi:hypothetical protein
MEDPSILELHKMRVQGPIFPELGRCVNPQQVKLTYTENIPRGSGGCL